MMKSHHLHEHNGTSVQSVFFCALLLSAWHLQIQLDMEVVGLFCKVFFARVPLRVQATVFWSLGSRWEMSKSARLGNFTCETSS